MTSFFESATGADEQLSFELLLTPGINYALVHNRVAILRHLSVRNKSATELSDITVTIELTAYTGTLAGPWRREIPSLPAGEEVIWTGFEDFLPDAAVLSAADEAFPATLSVTVERPWAQPLLATRKSTILAHDEWLGAPVLYDSLATFVQPNTVAVADIVREAGDILGELTGRSGLVGYQAGPERAVATAAAIYEALRRRNLTYAQVPPSFETTGQKVLTTAAVLKTRMGTCIDLAVTYAACLERAGLRPLIWLTNDHAFAGFHRDEDRLPEAVSLEKNSIINLVEAGRAIPVEMTGIEDGDAGLEFTAAVRAGLAHFQQPIVQLEGVVDVHLAHRSGIKPFPSGETVTDDGKPEPTERAEISRVSIDLPTEFASTVLGEDNESGRIHQIEDNSPPRIQRWKKSLLDLSLRNPLLSLPKRGKGLDLILPTGSLAILDDLIHDHKPIGVHPSDSTSLLQGLQGVRSVADLDGEVVTEELRDERRVYGAVTGSAYKRTLRALQRDARTVEQETGSNYLYLTLGALIHPNSSGGEARAPLFLVPVRIEGGTGRKQYSIVVDGHEVASPNHCLIEWLRVKHGVALPRLAEPILDESGIDVEATLAAIKGGLVEHRLDYRVDEIASLRLLRFSTFQMWKDLSENWETFIESPVVDHLVHRPGEAFQDPAHTGESQVTVDEAEMQLPIVADGSQMEAIAMAESGRSFVLEGPPGTGKSQTITNLISRVITSGKTMIFVAEKQAALEVVKRRVEDVGLGRFVLDLHGAKQSMPSIRSQLKDAIEIAGSPDDSTWQAAELSYRTLIADLAEYPESLHSKNPAGYSAWSAYQEVLAFGEGETLEVPASILNDEAKVRTDLDRTFQELGSKLRQARFERQHPWLIADLRSVDDLDRSEVADLAEKLESSWDALTDLPTEWSELIAKLDDPTGMGTLALYLEAESEGADLGPAAIDAISRPDWDTVKTEARRHLGDFQTRRQDLLARFMPKVFTEAPLADWKIEATAAAKGLFGKGKRQEQLRDRIVPFLAPGSTLRPEDAVPVVTALVETKAEAANVAELVAGSPAISLGDGWHPTSDTAAARLESALAAAETVKSAKDALGERWDHLIRLPELSETHRGAVRVAAERWDSWLRLLGASEQSQRLWIGEGSWTEAWDRDGATWALEIAAEGLRPIHMWAELQESLDVLRRAGLDAAADAVATAEIDGNELHLAYRRGLARTALDERLAAGSLRFFDGLARDEQVDRFNQTNAQVRAELPSRMVNALLALRKSRLPDQTRLGELKKQLDRKRGGLSFRELFEAYSEEILALTPCLLMSPASVATFIKPGSALFDLVVFDEASQIRVPQAIGAMGRAKAVVVVGDSKQMPPTNVMQVARPGEDEKSPVPEDMDSILSECVESGLDQVWLSWHYRSQDESLIAFSNQHYYEGKLSSLPSPGQVAGAGVEWRRVNGTFLRGGASAERTNEIEADVIVAEISRRLNDPETAAQSIGVVTFNTQQRDLILDKLEESSDAAVQDSLARTDGEGTFVKNLENVQGDERDVILFSLAFSKEPETDLLPLNFGPLSQQGGERRLNVAITRARRLVVLFSSFDPKDIELSRTNAVGTHHLRAYLEMASRGMERLGEAASKPAETQERILTEVAEALRARGLEVASHVGLSRFTVDLAARRPGASGWEIAIMLDGPEWAGRPTVVDRDSAPTLLTAMMHWPAKATVWLPDWIRDPIGVVDRIVTQIEAVDEPPAEPEPPQEPSETLPESTDEPEGRARAEARDLSTGETARSEPDPTDPVFIATPTKPRVPESEPGSPAIELPEETKILADPVGLMDPVEPPAEPGPDLTIEPSNLTDQPGQPFRPFQPYEIGSKADIELLTSSDRVQSLVRQTLHKITEAEGPIQLERLARLALKCFDFNRAPAARSAAVIALVPRESQHATPLGTFVWPQNIASDSWLGFRTTQDSGDRAFDEIPPEEINNAAHHILTMNPTGLEPETLARETLTALGYRRLTKGIEARLDDSFSQAVRSSRLIATESGRFRAGS